MGTIAAVLSLIACLLSLVSAQTPNRTYTLLEGVRSNITFVPYTPEQRVAVAKGLQNMFSIYVHREKKIRDYDAEYKKYSGQTIDPVPRVAEMVKNAANMTDKEFHYKFVDLFASLRDLHTNYEMPGPHACYGFIQAVDFTVATVKPHWYSFKKQQLVVQKFVSQPEINQLSYPEIAKMNIGDIVLKINGKTFNQYVESVKWVTGGNDESGALRGALMYLAARPGMLMKVPEENEVTYEMQSFNDPSKKYTVTLPWIASRRDDCIRKYSRFEDEVLKSARPSIFRDRKQYPKADPVEIRRNIKKNMNSMRSIPLEHYKEFFATNSAASKVSFNPTADSILNWAIYAPETKNMGILSIDSFVPMSHDDLGLVNLVRSLLLNELKNTNSLLLDMRDNGGGDIAMADLLPQLFGGAKPVVPSYARAIVAPINDFIFENSTDSSDKWYRATQHAAKEDIYSPLIQFTSVKDANQIGAVYFKPVGYFHNGNCFSACDLMAATVQDNEIMTVFGEDIRSGAGGANVVEYGNFLSNVDPDAFPKMPYSDFPDSKPINARLSWRQSVRVGKHAGELIEDDGILSDYSLIRPNLRDLIPGTVSNTQYDFIADKLQAIGRKQKKNDLYFIAQPDALFDAYLGTPIAFNLDLSGISKVQVYTNGAAVGNPLILSNTARQQRQIRFDPGYHVAGIRSFQLKAYNSRGNLLFTTSRQVRFIPNPTNYLKIQRGSSFNLDLVNGDEIAQFDANTDPGLGFVANGTALQIGNGESYTNNVNTQRSYYVLSLSPFSVSIDMDYQTEEGFDFFYFGYVQNKKVVQFLSSTSADKTPIPAVSGKGSLNSTFIFQVDTTGTVELFVKFVSDGGVVDKGVVIRSVTIQA